MRYLYQATTVALSIVCVCAALGNAAGQNLSIANYQFVSKTVATQTQSYVTVKADLINSGPALQSVTATVGTLDPYSVRVQPNQATLNFAHVPANGQVTSSNTFTVLVDSTIPLNPAKLTWTYQSTPALVIANAGRNQTAKVGTTVTLNGSGSTNPSGSGALTYYWVFTSRPSGTLTTLQNSFSVMPSFAVDAAGDYTIQMTVSNGVTSDSASVTVSTTHTAPVANAGPSQTVPLGSTATLNGSGSTDPDGNALTYSWTLLSPPAGSSASLSGAGGITPTFVVDKPGSYTAQLIVSDSFTASAPSTVVINTQNTPPVASAGASQVVAVGSLVQLNGAGSTDVDGNSLTYQWHLNTAPAGSTATISDPASVNPTFTADVAGAYVAQLIVNDGIANSASATVTITTNTVQAPTAIAGLNQTAGHNTTVALSGSGTDPQSLPLTFKWALINKPPLSTAALSSTIIATPTFVADLPGTYVAQLVVNNGVLNSVPSTVTITTTNTPPAASAGADQNVMTGTNVLLDGSGSSDSDHDPLTYSWTFSTRPTGSSAALVGANSKAPMFSADVAGVYVVQLIVNDGYANSTPVPVTITATQPPSITLSPNSLGLSNAAGSLTVTIPTPAGVNGQVISLLSGNSNVASVAANVTIAAGSNAAIVTVTPGNTNGSTAVTASASGYASASATVNVAMPVTVSFTPNIATINGSVTQNLTLSLSGPAPAGGLTISLSSSNSSVVTVPATVLFAAGVSSVSVPVTGIGVGTAAIHANALPNIVDTTATVTVASGILLPSNITVVPGQQAAFQVTLTSPAASAFFVALASSDTSKVTISPAMVFIPQGKTNPTSAPQVTGVNFGSAAITATAPGFPPASQPVQVSATLSFAAATLNITGPTTGILTLNLSAPAPAGGVAISLTSSNTAVATVPLSATIGTNATSVSIPVTGVASGTTVIHAGSLPAFPDTTATVTVITPGAIVLPSFAAVGQFHSTSFPLSLGAPAPIGGVTVTLSSSDSTLLTITPPSVFIAAGSTSPATQPRIAGLTLGYAYVNASAAGYSSASLEVRISDGIRVNIPSNVTVGLGQTISFPVILDAAAPTGGASVALTSSDSTRASISSQVIVPQGVTTPVTQAQLTGLNIGSSVINASAAGYTSAVPQTVLVTASVAFSPSSLTVPATTTQSLTLTLSAPAPSGGVTVTLTSSNSGVATVPATVTFPAGSNTASVPVTGIAAGSVVVHASNLPNILDASASVTVSASSTISLPTGVSVGLGQSAAFAVTLASAAPTGGVTITLGSSDSSKVSVTSSVFIAAGAKTPATQPQVTGVNLGSAAINASGPGFISSSQPVQVTASIVLSPSTLTLNTLGTQNLTITLSAPAPDTGLSVNVSSSNPAVVTVPSMVMFAAKTNTAILPVNGIAFGSATVRASALPSIAEATAAVTVGPGGSPILLPGTITVSLGQQTTLPVTLNTAAPTGGLTVTLSSSDSSKVTVPSSVYITAGATSVAVQPQVSGVNIGPATITASAPGYTSATAQAKVTATIGFLSGSVTVGSNTTQNGTLTLSSPAPAGGITVGISSDNTAAATVPSSVTFNAGTTSIAVPVTGVSAGSATIHANALPYIADTAASVTVSNGPAISLPSNVTVGPGVQSVFPVSISAPVSASGIFVMLTSSDPSKVTVSPAMVFIQQGASMPSSAPKVTGVNYGAASITAAAAGYASATQPVTVTATLSLSPSTLSITGTGTQVLNVTLSAAAPAGGVIVNLSSSNNSIATVPGTVTIPGNATSASVAVSGVAAGSAVLHANALPTFPDTTANVIVAPQPTVVFPSYSTIGQFFSTSFPVSLSTPAPPGGATIMLASSDTSKLTLTPSSVFIAAGATSPATQPQIAGIGLGFANITGSSLGYASATLQVHISDGIRVNLPTNVSVALGKAAVYQVILDAPAPAGGVTVTLSSTDATKVTVTQTVFIAAGLSTPVTQPQVSGVNVGLATINATAPGYTSASPQVVQVTASVAFATPTVTIPSPGTQNITLNLSAPAPAGGLTVNVSSSNVSIATVPASVTFMAGATSTAVPVTAAAIGSTVIHASAIPGIPDAVATVTTSSISTIGLPAIQTVGLSQSMSFPVTLAVAAPAGGVNVILTSSDTSKITVSPGSVFIAGGSVTALSQPQIAGVGLGSANITASAANYATSSQNVQVVLPVSLSPSNLTIAGAATQILALNLVSGAPAGLTVTLTSSNTSVAIVPLSLTFTAGATSLSVPVQGVGAGSTTIAAAVPGYGTATAMVTVTAGGQIGLPANVGVGLSQMVSFPVTLSVPAPVGGITVVLSSNDTSKVSVAPLGVFVAGGATSPTTQPQVTGVNLGSASITATAPGYTATTQQVKTTASLSFLPATLTINGAISQSLTLHLSSAAPAGGLTINLSSDNTAAATVPSTVTFAANSTTASVPVTGVNAGTATIHASALPNIADTTASVTVTAATGIILASNVTVGPNQTVSYPVSLASPSTSTVFVSLSSNDTSKVTISPATVVIQAGNTLPTSAPKITGVNFGPASITASAFGYPAATQQVQVIATAGFSQPTLTVPGTSTQFLTLTLSSPAPANGVTFNLSSDNTGIAKVPATVTIAANAISASVGVTGVALGATVIHASSLPLFADTTSTVTVVAAPVVVFPAFSAVGQFRTTPFPVSLSTPAPAGGVTITLSSSDTPIFTISPASVFVPAGATTPSTTPQVSGINQGYAYMNGTAPGYVAASLQMRVSDGIRINLPPNVSVKAGQSVAFGVVLDAAAPAGGVTVTLSSSDTSKATITATVFIAAGTVSPATPAQLTGMAAGSAVISASGAGYTSASPQTVQVTP